MSSGQFFNMASNLKYHNLCHNLQPPPGLNRLLGLGHKFCIETGKPNQHCKDSITRLRDSIRLKHWLDNHDTNTESNDESYNPKIYVKSHWKAPRIEDSDLEHRMLNFAQQTERAL